MPSCWHNLAVFDAWRDGAGYIWDYACPSCGVRGEGASAREAKEAFVERARVREALEGIVREPVGSRPRDAR